MGQLRRGDYTQDGSFDLQNGMSVWFHARTNPPGFSRSVIIDTNGYKNPPNKFGYDTFAWTTNGNISAKDPVNSIFKPIQNNTACNFTTDNDANGLGCSFNALTDSKYFDKLP